MAADPEDQTDEPTASAYQACWFPVEAKRITMNKHAKLHDLMVLTDVRAELVFEFATNKSARTPCPTTYCFARLG